MPVAVTDAQLEAAQEIVDEAHGHGGLAPLDHKRFWEDNGKARSAPWAKDCPQLPLGIGMSNECIFAELGLAEDWHALVTSPKWNCEWCRKYNDKAEGIVGRRVCSEPALPDPRRQWPAPKGLHDIFEAKNVWHHESYWLMQSADSPRELEALLDRVERRLNDLRAFLLPVEWDREKERLRDAGVPSPIYRSQRGPVTFATSIYGVENLIFLIMDEPDLAARFSELITRAIIGRAEVLDAESNLPTQSGWWWSDDNCCLLSPDMYDQFAYPVMRAVYDRFAPDPGQLRGQHSDSDMAHHLPTFRRLGMNTVNFGPNLTVTQIRDALPDAVIHGQLAPFTFSRNEEVNIVAETLRDIDMAREKRGVVFSTAGSINNGSRLTGLRLIMATIQRNPW